VSARTTATTATGERPAIPVPRDGWVQVANAFIDARPLDNERLAHILLMSYAWDDESCHPSQEELSGRLGVSVRTIKRRTRALRGGGTVTVTRGGKAHPNVYQLHVRPVRDEDGVQFTTLAHGVLDDPALSEGAKRAYVVLCRGAGGSGWWVISNAAIGARLGVTVRAVYNYVRELETAGHVRIVPHTGRVNTYHVGTPEQRKRSAAHGATAPLLVITQPRPADDGRWRALYEELMRVTPARQVVRGVRTLLAAVGEATVLEAIRSGAEWCAQHHPRCGVPDQGCGGAAGPGRAARRGGRGGGDRAAAGGHGAGLAGRPERTTRRDDTRELQAMAGVHHGARAGGRSAARRRRRRLRRAVARPTPAGDDRAGARARRAGRARHLRGPGGTPGNGRDGRDGRDGRG